MTAQGCSRRTEAALLIIVSVIFISGTVLIHFSRADAFSRDLFPIVLPLLTALWATHLMLRLTRSLSDETLLPLIGFLCAVGELQVFRLEENLAVKQSLFQLAGFLLFNVWYWKGFDYRIWEDYKYIVLFFGMVIQVLVMFLGIEINGAKLWFQIGGFSFQPIEIAKVLLVIFLASYLKQKKDFISSQPSRRFSMLSVKYLFPLVITWGCCEAVLVVQRDLGMALLLFGTFMCLFYIATRQVGIIIMSCVLFIASSWIIVHSFSHVHIRVAAWLDPWKDPEGSSFQILQALFAFAAGGFWGTGLGMGSPTVIPAVSTDFVFASIGEEMGFLGAMAVILAYLLMIKHIFSVAQKAHDEFGILLASGLGSLMACQVFIILGGTTKFIPMTGITLPFISYGGSSILANFFLLALVFQISHLAEKKCLLAENSDSRKGVQDHEKQS